MSESSLVRALLLRGSQLGARLFRNNVGRLRDGERWVQYGLCVGSSDLIGWVPVVIGPEHLGTTIALFVAVEAKTATGTLTPEQRAFLQAVRAAGGLGMVARSTSDLETALAPQLGVKQP